MKHEIVREKVTWGCTFCKSKNFMMFMGESTAIISSVTFINCNAIIVALLYSLFKRFLVS